MVIQDEKEQNDVQSGIDHGCPDFFENEDRKDCSCHELNHWYCGFVKHHIDKGNHPQPKDHKIMFT